jgi:hypothetical protein
VEKGERWKRERVNGGKGEGLGGKGKGLRVVGKGGRVKFSYVWLILFNNKEDVTFTWSTGVQNVLLLTKTGDKFAIRSYP